MNLLRVAASVSGMTLLSRITGFLRDTLIAIHFGAGALAQVAPILGARRAVVVTFGSSRAVSTVGPGVGEPYSALNASSSSATVRAMRSRSSGMNCSSSPSTSR